jgi:hypothetical protein
VEIRRIVVQSQPRKKPESLSKTHSSEKGLREAYLESMKPCNSQYWGEGTVHVCVGWGAEVRKRDRERVKEKNL